MDGREIFGGEEERIGELVFVGEDDAGKREMGVQGTGFWSYWRLGVAELELEVGVEASRLEKGG